MLAEPHFFYVAGHPHGQRHDVLVYIGVVGDFVFQVPQKKVRAPCEAGEQQSRARNAYADIPDPYQKRNGPFHVFVVFHGCAVEKDLDFIAAFLVNQYIKIANLI